MTWPKNGSVEATEVARQSWHVETTDTGKVTWESLVRACAIASFHMLDSIHDELQSLNRKLDLLGTNGIHAVIRDMAYHTAKRRDARLFRRRARRRIAKRRR